jgi:hypothetical protein
MTKGLILQKTNQIIKIKIKGDPLLALFPILHQRRLSLKKKVPHLNLDRGQNPLKENSKKSVKIALLAQNLLLKSKEIWEDQTLDQKNHILVRDLDLERTGNNPIKPQNFGITKEETTIIIGIIVIETKIINLAITEVIEVVEEEEVATIVEGIKEITIIGITLEIIEDPIEKITVEDITLTIIITIVVKRIIVRY